MELVADRTESAPAGQAHETLARSAEARALRRRLFVTPAHLRPGSAAGTLTVELHRCGSALPDATIAGLGATRTATQTGSPTTSLCLVGRPPGSR